MNCIMKASIPRSKVTWQYVSLPPNKGRTLNKTTEYTFTIY